jgi:hypothetical protein
LQYAEQSRHIDSILIPIRRALHRDEILDAHNWHDEIVNRHRVASLIRGVEVHSGGRLQQVDTPGWNSKPDHVVECCAFERRDDVRWRRKQ